MRGSAAAISHSYSNKARRVTTGGRLISCWPLAPRRDTSPASASLETPSRAQFDRVDGLTNQRATDSGGDRETHRHEDPQRYMLECSQAVVSDIVAISAAGCMSIGDRR
jgi:hypothetical protein